MAKTTPSQRTRIALSQNFLKSGRLVDKLLDLTTIENRDVVIEIGPGRGIITERLARRARQVIAIEMDPLFVEELRTRFAHTANVTLFRADMLEFPLPASRYKVFANIPYRTTTAIVSQLIHGTFAPADTYLVVQLEAAQRFAGSPRETLYALLLKPWYEPSIRHSFQRSDFVPEPAVDSVLLQLRRREAPLVWETAARRYRDFVAALFTAWQPTVGAALRHVLPRRAWLKIERQCGLDLDDSPTNIPFARWLELFTAFEATDDERAFAAIEGAEARLRHEQSKLQKEHRSRQETRDGHP